VDLVVVKGSRRRLHYYYLYCEPHAATAQNPRDPFLLRLDPIRSEPEPAMAATRVWLSALLLAFLLAAAPVVQVARAQSVEEAATAEVVDGADLGIVSDDTQVSSDGPLSPAPGVETVCVFPKNAGKSECQITISAKSFI
jgi:hypothetical protein